MNLKIGYKEFDLCNKLKDYFLENDKINAEKEIDDLYKKLKDDNIIKLQTFKHLLRILHSPIVLNKIDHFNYGQVKRNLEKGLRIINKKYLSHTGTMFNPKYNFQKYIEKYNLKDNDKPDDLASKINNGFKSFFNINEKYNYLLIELPKGYETVQNNDEYFISKKTKNEYDNWDKLSFPLPKPKYHWFCEEIIKEEDDSEKKFALLIDKPES